MVVTAGAQSSPWCYVEAGCATSQQHGAGDTGKCAGKKWLYTDKASKVLPTCKPGSQSTDPLPDDPYDNFKGWYDVQGCGKCHDYCGWAGPHSISLVVDGGNPRAGVRTGRESQRPTVRTPAKQTFLAISTPSPETPAISTDAFERRDWALPWNRKQ